jgi:hypothetical protein
MNTYFIQENDPTEEEIDAMSIEELDQFLEGTDSLFDWDGDALASAGFGTDEDYGGFSDEW